MTTDEIAANDFASGAKNESLYNENSQRGVLYRHGWQTARRRAIDDELERGRLKAEAEIRANLPPPPPPPEIPRDLFGNPV